MQPVMRPATAEDRELFWQLLSQAMRPYVEATWGWDAADQHARFVATFEPSACHVIELGGLPVGGVRVDYATTPIRLLNIQILPQFQRQGLGSAIIMAVLQRAADRPVWLRVLKVNPARALYERLGFRVTGETETHWQLVHEPAA
jgi:ribosomal protein S18 acetylase RimI-like enzyme